MRIKLLLGTLPAIFFLSFCKKQSDPVSGFSEAAYRVVLSGKWRSPEFNVPPGAHFTPVIGMVHSNNSYLFEPGKLASNGVERVAEDGNSFPLLAEIDSLVAIKKALSDFIIFTPSVTGDVNGTFSANSNYPFFSFESMIAPSPDWFIGLHKLDLMPGGKWITDTTINIYVYDAGTEDGDLFGQSNPDSSPHQPISLLTPAKGSVLANGNPALAPMATIRLVKQ